MAATRELNPRERQIRSNIRNAYFCEDQVTLEKALERFQDREDKLSERFVRELLDERQKEYDDAQAMRMDTIDMM